MTLETESAPTAESWKTIVARYQRPSTRRATWQLINTLVPYAGLWCLMYLALKVSWWLTLPLAALAGGFLVRIFIIFHDCGHGSFFPSRRANDLWGFFCGVLTFTPYAHWRWEHAQHHATAGDLDRRGVGDIWTMTVQEYLESSRWRRAAYRLARNPLVLFVVAPFYLFVVKHRFACPKASRGDRLSVYWTNLALFGMAAGMSAVFGVKAFVLLQAILLLVAGAAGVWLFYVQHQFEGVYWERRAGWDFTAAALQGSSYYRLPRLFQWFSGNIGFHHIHHLSPRIPNYHLEPCHRDNPLFQQIKPLTLGSSLKSLSFRLWDERARRLVGFAHLRHLRRQSIEPGRA